ncbi:MAG: HAMP domain-containing histidine kinase [Chloroflexi bacterium]|nr:HAMP domain-containing histidine kinase [Chloroflexota bacterium]
MSVEALAQARALLHELTEAARKGAIIPVQLPRQLEAIEALLNQAEVNDGKPAAVAPPDVEALLKDQAAFMSHAVHELRIPLTSIQGYSDMLNTPGMGDLNALQQQFLGTIRTNARRMAGLMTDFSDLSKLRAGVLRTTVKMDTLKNIAMSVEKQTRPLAEELNRELVVEIPQGLPVLNLDGELLAKALVKLVENALRYTPEGGRVTLSAAADGSSIHIRVQDNGIDMTPDELAQLGTVGFRADHDLVRSYKGSGMGLPIVYGIVRLLGGSVDVASEPGAGTTVTVTVTGMM